jgi:anti-sigma factor RsiW
MNDQLTLDDLRAYRAGQLSQAARHRVERLLLDNPFYADALDGLEALQAQATRSLPAQTADLRLALHRRVRSATHRRRLLRLWFTTAVAAILLALAVAVYLIFNAKPVKSSPANRQLKQTAMGVKSLRDSSLSQSQRDFSFVAVCFS